MDAIGRSGTGMWGGTLSRRKEYIMTEQRGNDAPPAVHNADPDRELEQKLRRNPSDDDAKVDVGSDESMDASDPPSSSQPGCADEPVPSSGFPG